MTGDYDDVKRVPPYVHPCRWGQSEKWPCDKCGAATPMDAAGVCHLKHEKNASVHHPSHYGGDTTYEAIKVIEAWRLDFCLGNAVKYIARAGKKSDDPIEDLKKARWYLDRKISNLENQK